MCYILSTEDQSMQRTVEEEGMERMEYARWTGGGKKPHQWGWENSANQLFAWSCRLRVLLRCTVHMYLHARYEDCQMITITECATFLRQRVTTEAAPTSDIVSALGWLIFVKEPSCSCRYRSCCTDAGYMSCTDNVQNVRSSQECATFDSF